MSGVSQNGVSATNAPQPIPFSQNWTSNLITANDDWSAVNGIVGFLGNYDATSPTNVDPRTLLTPFVTNDVDVVANQTAPDTATFGGVAEFDTLVNPVVALQGSGTADAPHIVIYLNTTGQSNVQFACNIRDIDGSADNAVQQVDVQYRVGSTGNYTSIAGGYIADATTGPSLATLVTPLSLTLPAAADNQALVEVRVITTNAAASDEWVGVDDISVTAGGGPTPTPTPTPSPVTGLLFRGNLSGNQEVPTNATTAIGSGTVVLNEAETMITVNLNFSGLAAPASAAHIHGPAVRGVNAGVLFGLTGVPTATSGSIPQQTFAVTPTQVTQLKSGLFYFNVHNGTFPGGQIRAQIGLGDAFVDLNGDSRTDFSIVRTAGGAGGQATWFNLFANAAGSSQANWGLGDDNFLTADINGDQKDDMIVWRPGVQSTFYVLTSGTNTIRIQDFGVEGDDPNVVADYDGDGKDDFAVYRAGNGTNQLSNWYYATAAGTVHSVQFGYGQDFPAPGDYDGDGRSDFVLQRGEGANGRFYKLLTTAGYSEEVFGLNLDLIVPGDYDGDGKTDIATISSVGGFFVWKYEPSNTPGSTVVSQEWGISSTDFPTQGDFDGDGRTDFAVWRPGTQSTFHVINFNLNITTQPWGLNNDIAVGNHNQH